MERVRWQLLLLPMLIAFLAFFLPALVYFIQMSFRPSAGIAAVGPGWTLENYRTVLTDAFYLRGLGRTVGMGLMTVFGTLVIGFPFAYLFVRRRSRMLYALFSLLYVSSLTSVVIRGLGWITLLGNTGPINRFLQWAGLVDEPVAFMGNVYGATIGMIHYMLPFMVLTLIPIVQMINPILEEAAAGMGAGWLRTFTSVVFPLALPGIVASSLLVFAISLGSFVIPRMIGGTTMHIMSILIEQQILTTFNYAIGATLAAVLFFLVLAIVGLTMSITRGGSYST